MVAILTVVLRAGRSLGTTVVLCPSHTQLWYKTPFDNLTLLGRDVLTNLKM